ncbi:hypothetical protein BDQ17DRAFT_1384876 [Cyathus striatus]|nr:hypothetical protein BDQ17DRAFT_1384876 [Cyathus striatus]
MDRPQILPLHLGSIGIIRAPAGRRGGRRLRDSVYVCVTYSAALSYVGVVGCSFADIAGLGGSMVGGYNARRSSIFDPLCAACYGGLLACPMPYLIDFLFHVVGSLDPLFPFLSATLARLL